jgi:hypothetical protein
MRNSQAPGSFASVHTPVASTLLNRTVVRALLATWILAAVFIFCLQQGIYRYAGKGVVSQSLRELNTWVSRFTSPPTTFEPKP